MRMRRRWAARGRRGGCARGGIRRRRRRRSGHAISHHQSRPRDAPCKVPEPGRRTPRPEISESSAARAQAGYSHSAARRVDSRHVQPGAQSRISSRRSASGASGPGPSWCMRAGTRGGARWLGPLELEAVKGGRTWVRGGFIPEGGEGLFGGWGSAT